MRELRNVVETLCLLRGGREARLADLPDPVRGAPKSSRATVGAESLTLSLDRPLDEMVGAIVQAVLDAEGGNRTQAAARLGVSVRTLQRYVASGRVADLPSKR
ncbi:MAG: hypothetical protein KA978_03440 [Deltaproteobacteria bacterium]|nr:hypothetical protein [Deltaproteobacteria bacterium]